MGKSYLSRHFVGGRATSLASIPFAAAGQVDAAGISTTHNVLAYAGWNEDLQEYQVAIGALAVEFSGNDVMRIPEFRTLAAFRAAAQPLSLTAAQVHDGRVILLASLSDGSLGRLRIDVPLSPGSIPESMQLAEDDFSGADLLAWAQAHQGPAQAVDINPGSHRVLSVGGDGTIAITAADAPSQSEVALFYECDAATLFTSCKWTTVHTFATTSLQGVLHCWDTRAGSGPVLVHSEGSCGGDGSPRQSLISLSVHPAQPFTCSTGSIEGYIATWDLRTSGKSVVHQVGSSVTCLEYDRSGGLDEQLAYCTQKGDVGVLLSSGLQVLYTEPNVAIDAVCLKAAGAASQLFASTEQEGLIFMANPVV